MPELKGTKTEKNLLEAFAGESQARNKYTYFASVAKKEGYEQIAAVFLETAEQEKEHAKLHLKALGGIGDTIANLKAAAAARTKRRRTCTRAWPARRARRGSTTSPRLRRNRPSKGSGALQGAAGSVRGARLQRRGAVAGYAGTAVYPRGEGGAGDLPGLQPPQGVLRGDDKGWLREVSP